MAVPERQARRRGWVVYWVLFGLAGLALAGGLVTGLVTIRSFTQDSIGMSNSVQPGDRLEVAAHSPVHRGEVIVEQQPPTDDYFVRRVIALPGDRVACCTAAGLITVNGKVLHETYLPADSVPSVQHFRVTVPPGRLWLMGDNRLFARDSRVTGPVAARVVGPVFLIVRGGRLIFLRTPRTYVADGLAPAGLPASPALTGVAVSFTGFVVLVVLVIIGAVALVRLSRRQSP